MLIAIDIGNSNTKVAYFENGVIKDVLRLDTHTHELLRPDALSLDPWMSSHGLTSGAIKKVIISSVVPTLNNHWRSISKTAFGNEPIIVSSDLKLPIRIAMANPSQLGADRIANAVAAYTKFGGPVIVVDFGTATNFEVVDAKGTFVGGVIAPGVKTSMAALAMMASQLFESKIEMPSGVIGKNTIDALKSGAFHGTVGQVDHIIDLVLSEPGFGNARVVATGGLATLFGPHSRYLKVIEPNLTLLGLFQISQSN